MVKCRPISPTCFAVGDRLELRGPIGGYFVWDVAIGGPLLLVGGGSGIVPLMAMLRHRAAALATAEAHARHDCRHGSCTRRAAGTT